MSFVCLDGGVVELIYSFGFIDCHCFKNGIHNHPHHHHRSNAAAQLCDSKFGHCLCKQGWHGPKCDSCSSGYWNAAATTAVATKDNNHIKNIDCKRTEFYFISFGNK